VSAPEHRASAERSEASSALRTAVADLPAAEEVSRRSSIVVGRDALGNVLVTGDGNTVEVKITMVVADPRLQAPAASTRDNPYRGLSAFRETDSELFFGRDDLKTRLRIRLHALLVRGHAPRLLPILGPSGTGKSSLVRAGLLPELVRSPMDGLHHPKVLVLRPGADPLRELAKVLVQFAATNHAAPKDLGPVTSADFVHRVAQGAADVDHRVVIFVDQLEELFTECTSEAARSAFLTTLAHAATQPDHLVSVIFAMRNDFAGSLRTPDAFAVAVRDPFRVSQMSKEQIVEAIARPAKVLEHPWPTGLVENLVLQCEGRIGALPLLQYALQQLWPEHVAGRLAESRWSSRLIEDFVVQRADELYEGSGLGPERESHQRIVHRAFVSMVQLGEGAADTRRVARLSEIVARDEPAEVVRAVIAPFTSSEARLVTVSESGGEATYELAHEALIGSWDRLRAWLGHVSSQTEAEAVRGELRLRRRLRYAAEAWQVDRGAVMRPPELDLVTELRKRQPEELSIQEHEYIDASVQAWEAHDRWRRGARRLGTGALVMLALLGLIALRQSTEVRREKEEAARQTTMAEHNAKTAQERLATSDLEQGRALLFDGHPMRALPYLLAAREEGLDSPVLRMLFARASAAAPQRTLEHRDKVTAAAFSPDGARVFPVTGGSTAQIWDVRTGQPVTEPVEDSALDAAAFSPDGAHVVTASAHGTARVWDARTGQPVTEPLAHRDITAATFSPDGARVVTVAAHHSARVWDARTGQPLTEPLEQDLLAAAFSADGARLVTPGGDHFARVWDARTGRSPTYPFEHRDAITAAAFSPDGACVVTASDDHTARVWDASTGLPVTEPLQHRGAVTAAAFSPDSARVVTASVDHTARVWDARTGQPVTEPLQHRGTVTAAAFSRDGTRVVTASDDHTARVWDASTGRPVTDPFEHRGTVIAAAFSPDGTRVVTASDDHTARVWDARAGKPLEHRLRVTPTAFSEGARLAVFSPDGARVITASVDPTAQVWDTRTGQPLGEPLAHRDTVTAVAFSADGARVLTASYDHTARIWDAHTGKAVTGALEHRDSVTAAAFSPDGARVVTTSLDHTARIWDARTGKPLTGALEHRGAVTAAAFSLDGARVVTASDDDTARVWDALTGTPVTEPFQHHRPVTAAAFSPDGTRVVTASNDHTARVWDARTGKPVTVPLEHRARVTVVAFSPDGTRVVTGSHDGTAQVWNARTGTPVIETLEHLAEINAAAFSPDSARVVTASSDGTARVWDARTGKPVTEPLELGGTDVIAAAFSSDGERVVTADGDGNVRVWELSIHAGSLSDWRHLARCAPFALENGILVANRPCP
jgi:WD40 repeat protein